MVNVSLFLRCFVRGTKDEALRECVAFLAVYSPRKAFTFCSPYVEYFTEQ